jgi:hypothetical protein
MHLSHAARSINGGASPPNFPLKKKFCTREIPAIFADNPLPFFEIKPQSTKISRRPLVFKNNSRYSPSYSQKLHVAPITSFRHILATVTPNVVIIVPKFSESLPLSSYTFI